MDANLVHNSEGHEPFNCDENHSVNRAFNKKEAVSYQKFVYVLPVIAMFVRGIRKGIVLM